jgi:hypothetical protein
MKVPRHFRETRSSLKVSENAPVLDLYIGVPPACRVIITINSIHPARQLPRTAATTEPYGSLVITRAQSRDISIQILGRLAESGLLTAHACLSGVHEMWVSDVLNDNA